MTLTDRCQGSKLPRAVISFRIGVGEGIAAVSSAGDAGLIFIREDGITI